MPFPSGYLRSNGCALREVHSVPVLAQLRERLKQETGMSSR